MAEEYKVNTTIYNGEPASESVKKAVAESTDKSPEHKAAEAAKQREQRAKLPKFELPDGEEFYITREQLKETNDVYFQMLNELHAGFAVTPEEMLSYMQSVVFESYKGDITKMQRQGAIAGMHDRVVEINKKNALMPAYVKKHWFSRKTVPNYAMGLCLQEAGVQAEIENCAYRAELARQSDYVYGEGAGFAMLSEILLEAYVPKLRRKRFRKKHSGEANQLLAELLKIYTGGVPTQPAAMEIEEPDAPVSEKLSRSEARKRKRLKKLIARLMNYKTINKPSLPPARGWESEAHAEDESEAQDDRPAALKLAVETLKAYCELRLEAEPAASASDETSDEQEEPETSDEEELDELEEPDELEDTEEPDEEESNEDEEEPDELSDLDEFEDDEDREFEETGEE